MQGAVGASPTSGASEALDAGPQHCLTSHFDQDIEHLSIVCSMGWVAVRSMDSHFFEGGCAARRWVARVSRRCSLGSDDAAQREALLADSGAEVCINILKCLPPTLVIDFWQGVRALACLFGLTRIFESDKWRRKRARSAQSSMTDGKCSQFQISFGTKRSLQARARDISACDGTRVGNLTTGASEGLAKALNLRALEGLDLVDRVDSLVVCDRCHSALGESKVCKDLAHGGRICHGAPSGVKACEVCKFVKLE